VRFGLYLPNFGPFGDPLRVAELAREAETAGWHGLYLWDHVARDFATEVADPWVTLAAVALVTERLRFGALVTPIPRRRPWKLARETVTLDRLSGGRLVFGAGIGSGRASEWRDLGEETDARRRGAMLDDGLELLARLWSGERVDFDGEHWSVHTNAFLPRPLQSPRIPVWVAAEWPARRPLERAARWDGVFPLFHREPGDELVKLAQLVARVRELREDDAPFDVAHLQATPTADRALAAELTEAAAGAGATWHLERLTPDEYGADWTGDWPVERMRERVLAGPAGPQSAA
jgi:alkanesulfonate monooxygenase SsuD/methylene tetrahydromethanopterin reductase-like flavin-dependent oxidoreductase (luciferase family)